MLLLSLVPHEPVFNGSLQVPRGDRTESNGLMPIARSSRRAPTLEHA